MKEKDLQIADLKKNEKRLQLVLDNSPFPIAVVDEKDQKILHWSKSALELFGHNPKTSEEWYLMAYPNPAYRKEVIERWKPKLEIAQKSSSAVNTGEYEIHCKNGTVKICELYAQFIPGSLIITLNDITERIKAEEQLNTLNQQLLANEQQLKASNQQSQASEQEFRSLYSNSPFGIMICSLIRNSKGKVIDFIHLEGNPSIETQTGFTLNDLVGKKASEIVDDKVLAELIKMYGTVVSTGETINYIEYFAVYNRTLEVRAYPLYDDKFTINFVDISTRVEAEKMLNESEEKFRSLMHQSPFVVELYDLDGLQIEVNKAYEELWDFPAETTLNKFNILKSKEVVKSGLISYVKKAYLGEFVEVPDYMFDPTGDTEAKGKGRTRWLSTKISPLKEESDKVTHIVITHQDITERKRAEEELTHSRDLMRYIIEHNKSAVAVHDRELNYLYVSQDYLKQYKVKQKDVIGKHHYEIFPDLPQKWRDVHKRALAGEISSADADVYERDDGTIEWTRWECRPWFDTDGSIGGIIVYTEIITGRKNAEEQLKAINQQLQASEQQLRATNQQLKANEQALIGAAEKAEEREMQLKLIADNFVDGMIYQVAMLDENRRKFTYVSDAVNKLYGCTPEQVIENPDLVYGKLHPDDRDELIRAEKEALESMSIFRTECRLINPDGSIRWSYFVSQPRIINNLVCWDGIEVDITKHKQIEEDLKFAKEKAEESDRLKSAFLANMSHEIRTPMNGILGFTGLLKSKDLTGEKRESYIDIIEKSGDRMLSTINDIIDISRIESGEVKLDIKPININSQLVSLYEFFKPETDQKEIELIVSPGLDNSVANIQTDPDKLYAILTNLIKNAIKYTQKGSIEFGYITESSKIRFYVKDTGEGIRYDKLESIFERFIQEDDTFTRAQQGSGLGLSIVKAYVELLGGEIFVESKKGKGSTFNFTIYYNALEKEKDSHELKIKERDGMTNSLAHKTILIAEDDETSYEYLKIVIKSLGVTNILWAKNGEKAIKLVKENPSIDLVLMDINMPVIDGFEATKAIKAFNPNLPIIAQTAYAISGDREKSIKAGCHDYISKPLKKEDLFEKLEKFLK